MQVGTALHNCYDRLALAMVDLETFSQLALGYAETYASPHFHKTSFRIRKKIFATLDTQNNKAVLKLSPDEQATLITLGDGVIPVTGSWGQQGWTEVNLANIDGAVLRFALKTAYCRVAPKALARRYHEDND